MFGIIFSTVITACHLYVFWRISSISLFQSITTRRTLTAVGLLIWLLFIAGFFYGHSHDNILSRWLELFAMTWMGTLFLLCCCLLAVEFLTGGGWFCPNQVQSIRGIALALGMLLSGIALYQGNKAPLVNTFEVTLPDLPATLDGTTMVAMTDMHLGTLLRENWLAARIDQVQQLHPDLVLLIGDIFEGHGTKPRNQSILLLRTLTAPMGVWGVPGNHEFYGGPQTIKALEESGVKLLRNSWAEVRPGLILAGVEEHTFSRKPEDVAGLITKALKGRASGATILLSHKPWGAEEAAKAEVELMLCGHTHDGQIWPFNYLVKRFFPLLAGRYQVNNLPVLVCRGTGTWGPHMRLWLPGEIMKITLRAGH